MGDARLAQAKIWLNTLPNLEGCTVKTLAGDASFRRYFRVLHQNKSYVLMDAPPEKGSISPFIRICHWLEKSGLNTPKMIAQDKNLGFLLLEDFGDNTWSVYMQQHTDLTPLFEDALKQIHTLQSAATPLDLPVFDVPRMQTEIDLYLDWYLPQVKKYAPSTDERELFHQSLLPLLQHIHHIPKAAVHLDYHSRNLMFPKQGLPLGVIDFQDAVVGPITYDLASLLYDCYQDYPENKRLKWSKYFFDVLPATHQSSFNNDFNTWHQSLRFTALQRHIKAMGIFSRLAYRDEKRQFLDEIPLTRKHLDDELLALSLNIPLLNT